MALTMQTSIGNLSSASWDPSNRLLASSTAPETPKSAFKVYVRLRSRRRSGGDASSCVVGGFCEFSWRRSLDPVGGACVLPKKPQSFWVCRVSKPRVEALYDGELMKVMIGGAPASGKGTQSELICKKYGLTHIATGDLLRAEVAAGTENGKKAKECMDQGKLVPDEVVVTMVKQKLAQSESDKRGWLLDGYPRSISQAEALEELGIRPQIFVLLEVPEDILIDRIVGRRIDPVTGKIYHLTYFPPETPEIASRLIQRSDDTVERAKLRLETHVRNMQPALSVYKDLIRKVDGSADKDTVFAEIVKILGDPEILPPVASSVVASSGN